MHKPLNDIHAFNFVDSGKQHILKRLRFFHLNPCAELHQPRNKALVDSDIRRNAELVLIDTINPDIFAEAV